MGFDIRNIPSMLALVRCCQWLLMVDNEESTVQAIQFTLQQFVFTHKKNTLSESFDKPPVMCPTYTLHNITDPHVLICINLCVIDINVLYGFCNYQFP